MRRKSIGLVFGFGVSVVAGCLPDVPTDRLNMPEVDDSAPGMATGAGGGAGGGTYVAPIVPPDFGATVQQADPPPPISGGTIAVAPDGRTVVAADPDRDRVYIVDIDEPSKQLTVVLAQHDEPGRVAIDAANRAHVVLRRGGAFVTIDLASGAILTRRTVCSAPRGIAYAAETDVVHVACAGGELVTFPAAGGPASTTRMLVRDLRDVVVVPGAVVVSTFRDARTYRVPNDTSELHERHRVESTMYGKPAVAWRMSALPPRTDAPVDTAADDIDDMLVAAQQVPVSGDDGSVAEHPPPPAPFEYYVNESLERCTANGPRPVILDRNWAITLPQATLPVDAVATPYFLAVIAAANGHTPGLPQLVFVPRHVERAQVGGQNDCRDNNAAYEFPDLQLTSVAVVDASTFVAFSREPAALVVVPYLSGGWGGKPMTRIPLATESREDTGHAIFHANSGYAVACASCHPEGGDDGHSWKSIDLGARRTPSLRGTLAGTAPYHWNGEAADMTALMKLTFESRMRGPVLDDDREAAVSAWLTALPAPPSVSPVEAVAARAVARGKTLFEGEARCSTCHAGAMHTNNATLDVGTGGAFQVPSLVGVSWRAPYLHDGTAPTVGSLLDRTHGGAPLSTSQKSDLDAYVGTL